MPMQMSYAKMVCRVHLIANSKVNALLDTTMAPESYVISVFYPHPS